MSNIITIKQEDPNTPDTMQLMDELSDALETITGNSGRSSFSVADVYEERAVFVVARNQNGEPVGCGVIRPMDDKIAEVKRMYARYKGMGIGTKILSHLETKAQQLGYSILRLETRLINKNAVAFYENKGYYRIPNYGKYIDIPEAVCFEKRLLNGNVHMEKIFKNLTEGFSFTDNIADDSYNFFIHHGKQDIAEHCIKVAKEAKRLSEKFGLSQDTTEVAGYLHDISRVIPYNEYFNVASSHGIEVCEEEKALPMLLHQKISKAVAEEVFHIHDKDILNTIECHTTLRANVNNTDLILFIADKLSWDSEDSEPILDGIHRGLEISLEHGAFSYIKYLWDNRNNVKVMHPWTIQAYQYLSEKCKV